MNRLFSGVLPGLLALMAVPFANAQTDMAGAKDYPGLTRMTGYYINDFSETEFDSYSFKVKQGAASEKEQAVEGHKYEYRYNLKDDAKEPSQLQVVRNYENAARAAGGQVLFDSEDRTTLRIAKGGKEVWFDIAVANKPSGTMIRMTIIEKQAMQQEVAMDAAGMAQGLSETGSVAIYGIHFDTGKADLKPDSEPTLVEIAKLLQSTPALKIFVVGHTDMVGDLELNLKLSQQRSQAVVAALVGKHRVAASRLTAFGNGPYAPAASNKTEEGRAKNRRVELVEAATK